MYWMIFQAEECYHDIAHLWDNYPDLNFLFIQELESSAVGVVVAYDCSLFLEVDGCQYYLQYY